MAIEIDYADTQRYVQHFRDKGCQPEVVDNTEGFINLFWYTTDLMDQLKQELDKKTVNIVRLKEMLFGSSSTDDPATDKASNSTSPDIDSTAKNGDQKNESKPKPKPKGHGRRGVDGYPGAKGSACKHDTLKAGDTCPQCHQGPLLIKPPKVRIQFDGHPPLMATRYELEQLECSTCLFTRTATAPIDLTQKYTPKAKATLAYLHYGMGVPYYRLAKMQQMLGVSIAVSTQSELIASMMGPVHAIFNHLMGVAAQCDCLYQDPLFHRHDTE